MVYSGGVSESGLVGVVVVGGWGCWGVEVTLMSSQTTYYSGLRGEHYKATPPPSPSTSPPST